MSTVDARFFYCPLKNRALNDRISHVNEFRGLLPQFGAAVPRSSECSAGKLEATTRQPPRKTRTGRKQPFVQNGLWTSPRPPVERTDVRSLQRCSSEISTATKLWSSSIRKVPRPRFRYEIRPRTAGDPVPGRLWGEVVYLLAS